MAFKKTFSSEGIEPVGDKFPKGCKFIRDRKKWTVTASWQENNADWRRMVADDGTDEVVEIKTLERDLDEGAITFVESTDEAGVEIAKRDAEDARLKREEEEENDPDAPVEIDLEEGENKHKFHKKF